MRHLAALHLAALAFPAALAAQDAPESSVDDLSCKLVRTEPVGDHGLLLEVVVTSRATQTAEPVEFLVKLTGEEHRVRRVPFREAGRRGRAVPPGGEQHYWLQVATELRPRGRSRTAVEVARATFHDGPGIESPPVRIVGVRDERVEEGGARVAASVLATANDLDRPVDVLLLAACDKPVRGRILLPARVDPGADGSVTIDGTSYDLVWEGPRSRTLGVRIRKAEVVDWSAVFDDRKAPVLDEFSTAWRAWRRWDEVPVGWGGRFRLHTERTENDEQSTRDVQGRFSIGAGGDPRIEVEATDGSGTEKAPRSVFDLAFRDLRRPSLHELKSGRGLAPFDAARVEVPRPAGAPRDELGDTFEVRDGRIVGSTSADTIASHGWTWYPEPLGDGYVVARREEHQAALGTTIRERRTHVVLPNGAVFPTALWREETYGAIRVIYELRLEDLAPATGVHDDPPTGAAADALRAAWDAVYVYPAARVDVTADLEVDHPNTDGVWAGVRKVRGKLALVGFRGYLMGNARWHEFRFDIDGKKLAPAARQSVANAVDDRLGLWAARDFAGRSGFDRTFRGAKVREESPGRFAIDGAAITLVVVADGLPREIRFRDGHVSSYRWTKVGDAIVPAQVRSGDEVLTVRFRDVGGLLLPIEMRFEHVFGRDWGPESLTFKHVRVERPR